MAYPLEIRRGAVGAAAALAEGWSATRDQYFLLLAVTFFGLFLGSLAPFGLLMGPAMCGIHLCYLAKIDGRRAGIDQLLRGFDHFLPGFAVALLTTAAVIVAALPLFVYYAVGMYLILSAGMGGDPPIDPELFVLGGLALLGLEVIIVINVQFFAMFAYLLIVDRGLGGVRSFLVSVKAVWANLGGLAGMLMLASSLALVVALAPFAVAWFVLPLIWAVVFGIVLSIVLTLLTLPPILGAITVAYRRIFPAETGSGVVHG